MGQRLQNDKIGTLSHNAGIISLAPSRLTIGGQQYNTSELTRTIATDVTLTTVTRYQVYAVLVSGNVQLRISTNENSVGPNGFISWKLVGSFYSNGLGVVGLGSFVNIIGKPSTMPISFAAVTTWTNNTTVASTFQRDGNFGIYILTFDFTGSPNATGLGINLPSGQTFASNIGGNNTQNFLESTVNLIVGAAAAGIVTPNASDSVTVRYFSTSGTTSNLQYTNTAPLAIANGSRMYVKFRAPISEFNNTQIEDL